MADRASYLGGSGTQFPATTASGVDFNTLYDSYGYNPSTGSEVGPAELQQLYQLLSQISGDRTSIQREQMQQTGANQREYAREQAAIEKEKITAQRKLMEKAQADEEKKSAEQAKEERRLRTLKANKVVKYMEGVEITNSKTGKKELSIPTDEAIAKFKNTLDSEFGMTADEMEQAAKTGKIQLPFAWQQTEGGKVAQQLVESGKDEMDVIHELVKQPNKVMHEGVAALQEYVSHSITPKEVVADPKNVMQEAKTRLEKQIADLQSAQQVKDNTASGTDRFMLGSTAVALGGPMGIPAALAAFSKTGGNTIASKWPNRSPEPDVDRKEWIVNQVAVGVPKYGLNKVIESLSGNPKLTPQEKLFALEYVYSQLQ